MKKLYFISFLLISFILNSQENVFFSEYAEGSSNNKYLEIFNNSDQTIDLSQYAFPNVSNDPNTVGEYEYWNNFDDGSTIEPYAIFVIAHPEADEAILAEADMTSFLYLSNGDDGFKLVYGSEESFTVLDEIGDWQGDPGAGWDVAGVTSGTKDHTLVRKSSVQNGNTWSNSAGSTAEDSEWIVYDQNTWTYLGTHEIETPTASCQPPSVESWTMGDTYFQFESEVGEGVASVIYEFSTEMFVPGDGTAVQNTITGDFPGSLDYTGYGLSPETTYYFAMASVCEDGTVSEYIGAPDAWTTSGENVCETVYTLPYMNDFNDLEVWESCNTYYDNDGDGAFWLNIQYDGDEEGNRVSVSQSWANAALTPDNWFVLGPIDLTDESDVLLEWKVRGIDPSWCAENYSVYVGSSSDYSELINSSVTYTETISTTGDACGNTFADRSLDISGVSGNLVYIGFRHHDVTDQFVINIDDVAVSSSTMSSTEFTLQDLVYTYDHQTDILSISSQQSLSNIKIYNMVGQEVMNNRLTSNTAEFNLSNLSSAVYIVNVEGSNSTSKTFKLSIN